jgi:protein-S-isoprenylcysteine O-methyltransferase Ste14
MSEKKRSFPVKALILAIVFIAVLPLLPIFISGKWNWWEVWGYAVLSIVSFILSRYIAGKKNPGLLAERAKYTEHDDAEKWDKILSPLMGSGGVLILVVVGLDALYDWTMPLSLFLRLVGIGLLFTGHILGAYALYENTFFSGMVRLQTDRGHYVIDTGPYAWVRHPGYAGALLTYFGTPLFLNSWWAFIPTIFMITILVYRTSKEDAFLQENLPGYKDFTEKTQYRLFPGIW